MVKVISTQNHSSKEYTFQELEDLISRMVLITGKGTAEKQTGLMQKYLEVSNCTIILVVRNIGC